MAFPRHTASAGPLQSILPRVPYAEMLAMHTAEATQYTPRFQSPEAKQAIADPRLQTNRIPGKINLFGICKGNIYCLVSRITQSSHHLNL